MTTETTDLEIPAFLDKRTKTPKASPTLAAAGRDAQPSSLSSQAAPADAQVGGDLSRLVERAA